MDRDDNSQWKQEQDEYEQCHPGDFDEWVASMEKTYGTERNKELPASSF